MNNLELIPPRFALIDDYLAMLKESLTDDEEWLFAYVLRLLEKVGATESDYHAYLRRLEHEEKGYNLPLGFVPQTTYWLVRDGSRVVGESRLRHYLTPTLEIEGGHIGYFIRRSERMKGYGTHILELMLENARRSGLNRALITCDSDNIGSARIIQKNGGKLAGEDFSLRTGKPVSRYWIVL